MKKSKILTMIFLMVILVSVIGISYAFFMYYKTGLYTYTISGGKIDVIYEEETGNNIVIDNAYPLTDEEALTKGLEFEFSVSGYNESEKHAYYAIEMDYGEDISGKTRFKDTDMKLSLYKNDILLFENEVFSNLDNQSIYYDRIKAGTKSSAPMTNTYKLRIWINDSVFITNTPDYFDTTDKSVYTAEGFELCYASFKVNINADLNVKGSEYLVYDANGGEFSVTQSSILTGMVTSKKPILEGKGFLGWSSDPNATIPEYRAGDYYNDIGQTLYAVWSDIRNVMDVFPSTITNQKNNILETYFISAEQETIDSKYNAASIKADITYNNQGKVLCWLEPNESDSSKYNLYIGSDGTTYLNSGNSLFLEFANMQKINFANLDTIMTTTLAGFFGGCSSLTNIDLSMLDTRNVSSMKAMFSKCINLTTLDLSTFDTSKVQDMSSMFSRCNNLTSVDVSGFNTSEVTNMSYMFSECYLLTSSDVKRWDTSKITNMMALFLGCESLLNLDLSNFDTENTTTMIAMFSGCTNLKTLNVSSFNTTKVTDMSFMFGSVNIQRTNGEVVKFSGCENLTTLDLSSFVTSNVTTFESFLWGCSSLTSINISSIDTSNATNLYGMFSNCPKLTSIDVSHFNTSKVTTMYAMFSNCSSLKNLDLSNFNTSKVTDMSSMFLGCRNLETLNVSSFNTSNVTLMTDMFYNCGVYRLDLSSFDTSKVTSMKGMFAASPTGSGTRYREIDISNFTFNSTLKNNSNNYTNMFLLMSKDVIIYVKDTAAQEWILSLSAKSSSYAPSEWTTANIIVKSTEE